MCNGTIGKCDYRSEWKVLKSERTETGRSRVRKEEERFVYFVLKDK